MLKCFQMFELPPGERVPKVLPCAHSFCEHCLVEHACGKSCINCPTCRVEWVLPGGHVKNLKNNFALLGMNETFADA